MAGLGPWVSLELDEEYARESCWKVGDVIESCAYDDDGKAQGRTLMVVVAPVGALVFRRQGSSKPRVVPFGVRQRWRSRFIVSW